MSEQNYFPAEIEKKWQDIWESKKVFEVNEEDSTQKYYLLEMLPYPTGRIHMGHVRNYTIGDVAARYKMMRGFRVLHPMGWDAFGMPAENAAIKNKVHPADWTLENIDYMKGQLRRLGFSYDWRREVTTCLPEYYKWEQLVFTKMFEKGWAYKKSSPVNWCPSCATVLANEQVSQGKCWRCDSGVVMKSMSQWYLRITDYAEELLRDIDEKLTGWPERVRIMQKEWIGRSEGAKAVFKIDGGEGAIEIFTTRPDTIYGATFLCLSYQHPKAREFANSCGLKNEFDAFYDKSSAITHDDRLADKFEKDGVFTGAYCINPLSGDRIPIYAANFVLMEYGTGAVMCVPAHDQRDFEFAKKFKLPIKIVVNPPDKKLDASALTMAYCENGVLTNSGEFSEMSSTEAITSIGKRLSDIDCGGPTVTYKLKDWCVSRQRYWGAPIPIINCENCGSQAVPENDLPVLLPRQVEFTGEGASPLARVKEFVEVKCPKCKGKASRETDTLDTFVESSWYMMRYTSAKYDKGPLDRSKVDYWLPVDQYIGGIEHAVGHLIYCRYYTKVLRDLGFVGLDEPVKNLMTQGMVYKDGAKMSKSKGNVVDPDDMIAKYGADTMRLFSLFAAPPEKDLEWNDKGVEGSYRFLCRVWNFVMDFIEDGKPNNPAGEDLARWTHKTIKKVTDDVDRFHFNTAISSIMEYVNFLYQVGPLAVNETAIRTLIILLSPFAPHVAEELWLKLGRKDLLIRESWPAFDESKIKTSTVTVVVQVNGKVRDRIDVPVEIGDEELKKIALSSDKVIPFLSGTPKKVVVVPKKLVNVVA